GAGEVKPTLVVLSACYSGGGAGNGGILAVRHMAPLAVELVQGGVPIVIGMAGRIAEHPCRVFTRRLGEALATGEPLVLASSDARFAALHDDNAGARASVDWAFPTVFLSERVPADFVPVEPVPAGVRPTVARRIRAY